MSEAICTPSSTSAPSNGVIDFNKSDAWQGKTPKHGIPEWKAWSSYQPTSETADDAIEHLVAGGSLTPARFQSNVRQEEYFVSQQLVIPDFEAPMLGDVTYADVLANDFARKHLRLLMHTESSRKVTEKNPHGYDRLRGLAVYDEPIEGLERGKVLNGVVLSLLHPLPVDKSFTKPTQPAHGSTNHVEPPYINGDAEPICVREIAGYLAPIAAAEMLAALAPPPVYIPLHGVEAEAKTDETYNRLLNELRAAPKGQRSDELTRIAYTVFGMAKGGQPGLTEEQVERDLKKIADGWGGNVKKSYKTIEKRRAKAPPMPLRGKRVQPYRASGQVRIVQNADPIVEQIAVSDEVIVKESTQLDYAQLPDPMRLWQGTPMMICCPEYELIAGHAFALGVNDFTAAQVAASAGCSVDTAQRWIDKTLRWKAISERSAEIKSNGVNGVDTLFKNAERQKVRGAAIARHYCLTPELAQPMIDRFLPDYVQELMERGTPDIVRLEEALAAGLDEQEAARLELTTAEVSRTIEADEVIANNERRALQKARDVQRLGDVDDTPFLPDTPACSLSELRAQRIEALIATKPKACWLHSELMWVAGVKRGSVSALIKKTRYTPADVPTYLDVPVQGSDLRQAVRVACGKHKGAAVAWLDANAEVICGFSGRVPVGAAGVKLNLGKQYIRRANIEPLPPEPVNEKPAQENNTEQQDTAAQDAEREQKKMRRFLLPRLRGCVEAQGWRYVPGPYGYWERRVDGVWQTCENTWDGMVNALLGDYEWAEARRAQRSDDLLNGVDLLGAEVEVLP